MKPITIALGIAATVLIQAAAYSDDKPKSKIGGTPADLLGGYTIVSGERYGEKEPVERIEGVTVRIADDAIIVLDKEKKEVYAQTYKLDTSATPWKITLRSKITPFTQKSNDSGEDVAQGLIEKEGDTVKLIYALPGGAAPTEFKTKQKQLMFVMKNERKDK
jgi:uncharacterized protein (TIGR03067 family)